MASDSFFQDNTSFVPPPVSFPLPPPPPPPSFALTPPLLPRQSNSVYCFFKQLSHVVQRMNSVMARTASCIYDSRRSDEALVQYARRATIIQTHIRDKFLHSWPQEYFPCVEVVWPDHFRLLDLVDFLTTLRLPTSIISKLKLNSSTAAGPYIFARGLLLFLYLWLFLLPSFFFTHTSKGKTA